MCHSCIKATLDPHSDFTVGAATVGLSRPGSDGNEEVFCFSKAPGLLKPYHQIVLSYPGHSMGESYPLQRCSQYILQPQPTWPHPLLESYPSAKRQSVYITDPVDWATLVVGVSSLCRDAVGVFYRLGGLGHPYYGSLTPLQRSSQCILRPQLTGHDQKLIPHKLLYIDLRPGQTCHSKAMHQKEVTHSNGQ